MTWQDMTDWFPAHINPVRVGYYQRDYQDTTSPRWPDYWDGRHWYICNENGNRVCHSRFLWPWRGLRRPQK